MHEPRAFDAVLDPVLATIVAEIREAEPEAWPISDDQGHLLYLLARSLRATRAVEFATAFGVSTLYLAAAMRDMGGGVVIGSEIDPRKAQLALGYLERAGLTQYVELRLGDALDTLGDVGGPIDLVLVDGWPTDSLPSLDLRVFQLLAPQMRSGAIVLDDNGEPDLVDFLRDPGNGFRSMALALHHGSSELAVKL